MRQRILFCMIYLSGQRQVSPPGHLLKPVDADPTLSISS